MKLFEPRTLALAAAAVLLCATHEGAAQSSGNINLDTLETLEFQVRVATSPGTQRVYCYQSEQLRLVGTSAVSTSSTVAVPISLPDPVIRCSACNSFGCSSLSANAAVVVAAHPLDLDGNSVIDVRDMTMCYVRLRDAIF